MFSDRHLGHASERPMITQLIFDWAKQTPDKTAVIYNGGSVSYRSFAQAIAVARSYFARRGYVGSGYAVLAVSKLIDFWILSLALRRLGLTTVAVSSAEEVGKLGLPNVRCVITRPDETWAGLATYAPNWAYLCFQYRWLANLPRGSKHPKRRTRSAVTSCGPRARRAATKWC